MGHRHVLILLGLVLVAMGFIRGGWFLPLIWLGADFTALGVAHCRGFHGLFGKRPDGSLPAWSWLLFLPLLLFSHVTWFLLSFLTREPSQNSITPNLVVGRRLLPGELQGPFVNYIDLTAEFAEPAAIRRQPAYRNFPVLDGSAPDAKALLQYIRTLPPGRTYVHCAQGHGRAALFALALLIESGAVRTVAEGLQTLKSARPGINFKPSQRRCVEEIARICESD